MNILFLTIGQITNINQRGIYTDLMRKFRDEGHKVTIVSPVERRTGKQTSITIQSGIYLLNVRTLNIQKTNIIEKGLATLLVESQYKNAIKKHLNDMKFDLVLYSTPPITFTEVIKYIKKKDNASSYLLLKDIFPQNAVDIGLMRKDSLLYRFFRKKETALYCISDYIGCMSPANVKYILNHNAVEKNKIEVCPNSVEMVDLLANNSKESLRNTYQFSQEDTLFIYGGNLGKPQGLYFLLKVLESNKDKKERFFFIVGSGTEYKKIEKWFNENKPRNAVLIAGLPKKEYDNLVQCCDVGLIFLDPRFTIPNYPSRLLSYLEYKMPVLMATDKNTDIGKIAEENGYGVWTENGNLEEFNTLLDKFCDSTFSIKQMGEKGYEFLKENYTVDKSYEIIIKHFR